MLELLMLRVLLENKIVSEFVIIRVDDANAEPKAECLSLPDGGPTILSKSFAPWWLSGGFSSS